MQEWTQNKGTESFLFLTYEVDEIEQAGLVIGEDEELEEQFKRFSMVKR